MLVGGELKDSGTDETRETTGEIKNTHNISVGNRGRRRHISRPRARWNVDRECDELDIMGLKLQLHYPK